MQQHARSAAGEHLATLLRPSASVPMRGRLPAGADRKGRRNRWSLPILLGASLILGACGGSGGGIETGETGGAGGGEGDMPDTSSAVEPLVGLYDITGNWSGIPELPQDEATLVIRALNADGTADVVILDFDDGNQNCSFASNVTGTALESPITGAIFLDNLPDFDMAVLELSPAGDVLTLQDFTDFNDIDDDGDFEETVASYTAVRLAGLSEADVPLCGNGF